jgi:predicted  nucleic acid-binding Zn-ribbon protein
MSIPNLSHKQIANETIGDSLDNSSNNLLKRADILLQFRDRLQAVEVEFDLAKDEITALKQKNQELAHRNFLKETEVKELTKKIDDMNSKKYCEV